jgi:transposase
MWRQGRPKKNAIGRSKGGRTTKIHLAVDKKKRPVRVLLSPGNDHDITKFDDLMEGLHANACLADKAYDSKRVIKTLESRGIEPVIPARACSEPRTLNETLYAIRYLVECSFHDLKRFRRIATRYEKTARNFSGFLFLACTILWT